MTSPGGPAEAEDLRRWRRHPAEAEDNEEEEIDHFDRLPDSVLLLVFNRVGDVKDLGRCCVVCSRFHSLVRLVDSVLVRVDCVISDDPSPSPAGVAGGDSARGVFSHLARVVLGGIARPFQALGHILAPSAGVASDRRSSPSLLSSSSSSSSPLSEFSHHSPAEVLKNFKEIHGLRIELPAGELGVDDGVLLKWKAEFGSTLDSCLILSASSVLSSSSLSPKSSSPNSNPSLQDACGVDDGGSIPDGDACEGEDLLSRDEFLLRLEKWNQSLWQISVHDPMEHLMLLLTSFLDMKFDEYSVPILNMFSDIVLKVFHVKQK
ncbi:hypothetical protein C4D60_Mb10t02760 [Musa balbisiana]|uniref:F-box domain-containing protein n=1 Tax=Musa balbisiana TaxID=52838 RepID=A0A4S8IU64_MUSBA|nr:hypothetical protein C4D60_Mb10t02760 [Musa balbisiana]